MMASPKSSESVQEHDQGTEDTRQVSTESQSGSAPITAIPTPPTGFGYDSEVVIGITSTAPSEHRRQYASIQQESKSKSDDDPRSRNLPTSSSAGSRDTNVVIQPHHAPQAPEKNPTIFTGKAEGTMTVSSCTDGISPVIDVSQVVNAYTGKRGLAFLCVCTGYKDSKDYIENCIAMKEMQDCLEKKLGYVTVPLGTNVTTYQLDSLLNQFGKFKLPESFDRVVFYFFGHGNDLLVKFANTFVERKYIISKFQSICPPKSNVYKIFIFDSCRKVNGVTTVAVEETCQKQSLEQWQSEGQYPESTNTLVINSTDYNHKAYYTCGCGLMTKFFTELAPTRNESLRDLLAAVRQKIFSVLLNGNQVLVYEDKLMGKCNLLAESQGEARVVPAGVNTSVSVLSTNVHFSFDKCVEEGVQEFKVQVSCDDFKDDISTFKIGDPSDRMCTLADLTPVKEFGVRVVAVYKDGARGKSEASTFTTQARLSPTDIRVTPHNPGSPSADVMWSFAGEPTHLSCIRVVIQVEGKPPNLLNVVANMNVARVTGLVARKKHKVSVIAVYADGVEKEDSVYLDHDDLLAPERIKVTPEYSGSSNAAVEWAFNGAKEDLSHFHITVEVKGKGLVFDHSAMKDEEKCQLSGLKPAAKHKITVTAVYADNNQRSSSLEFEHEDRSFPEGLKVTQSIPGSPEATVKWHFPEECTKDLKHFLIRVWRDGDTPKLVAEYPVTKEQRNHTISKLQPSTVYKIGVVAEYLYDGVVKENSLKYTNCELQAATIRNYQLFSPKDNIYTVEWDYDRQNEPLLEADHFKLKAVPTSTEQDPDNEGTIFECFDNPYTRKGEIKLISPGTTYRVSVITYFKCGDIPPQESTEFVEVATPPEHMVRPTLKCNTTEQNSVTINSTKPLILENKDKFACQTLELTKIRYTIRKAPQDGNDGKGKEAKYLDFTPSYPSDDNAATPGPAQSQRTVKGLKVGTKYFVTGQVEYNNGEIIESEEIPFETRPYTDRQKCSCSCRFLAAYLALGFLFILALFLVSASIAYYVESLSNRSCSTKYILTDDSIECGRADSTKYHKITISGSREDGDSLLGLMEAFSITKTDLESRFYTKQHKPIMDGGNVTFNLRHLLLGWQVFMWTGSKIYGYCCITNNNDTRQTATMNIFTDDHDAINFMNGGAANNAVASETIHIPPGRDVCFEEWGKYTPFVVRRNSYYLIVVDFPAQTSFASNITISQKTVNLTGLQSPHFFRYDNATDIILPMWPLFSHEEYIVICKAPKYVYRVDGPSEIEQQSLALAANNENPSDIELLALMVGAESLHLESCNIPYPWTKIVFLVLLVLGIIFFLFSVVTCVICIHVCRRCRDRLTNPCKSKTHRSRDGGAPYDRLGNVQTE